jgi:hypothetical protein
MRHIQDRGSRGFFWFALALLAVLLGSSAQVALRGYAASNSHPQGDTAGDTVEAAK